LTEFTKYTNVEENELWDYTTLQHKAATDIPSLLVFLCVTISPGKKRKEKGTLNHEHFTESQFTCK